MAVKILLAAVAALSALQLTHGTPVLHARSASTSASDVESILDSILQGIEQFNSEVEAAINSTLVTLGDDLISAVDGWTAKVNDAIAEAQAAGTDIQECLDAEEDPIAEVAAGLLNDTQVCVQTKLDELTAAQSQVNALRSDAESLVNETAAAVKKCEAKGIFLAIPCLALSIPSLGARAIVLNAKYLTRSAVVAAKLLEVAPLAGLCTAKSVAGSAADALDIADTVVACIKAKLAAADS